MLSVGSASEFNMSDESHDWVLTRVDLDRNADDRHKQRARELFETARIGIRGRYAIDVQTIVELLGVVATGAAGSALWDLLKWSVPRVRAYLSSGLFSDGSVAVTVLRLEAKDLTWELRYRSDQDMSEYRAGVLIGLVDAPSLPDDTRRVSINLIERQMAAFDQTGLKIADLPWPDDLVESQPSVLKGVRAG
jgi:hypothetical protein